MMKKIVGVLFVGLLVFGGYKGYKYYQSTYSGISAYAVVPKEIPTKEQTKDDSGNEIPGYSSYNYTFSFIKDNGETQTMSYELHGENPSPFTPGAIVKAKISEKRVIEGPNEVSESDVPTSILEKLK